MEYRILKKVFAHNDKILKTTEKLQCRDNGYFGTGYWDDVPTKTELITLPKADDLQYYN